MIHQPVLLKEAVDIWHSKEGGFYIDGTVGMGGHTEALLSLDPKARCLALDRDIDAVRMAKEHLKKFGERAQIIKENFVNLALKSQEMQVPKADGLLLDLGVSSYQLETGPRGFSFKNRGPLDMRMDTTQGESVLSLIHRLSYQELARVIHDYGEERLALPIAKALKEAESNHTLTDTVRCSQIISALAFRVKRKQRVKIHPATKTFQALRIAVNGELENLELFLKQFPSLLSAKGHAVFISFHSLEDRLVKNSIKDLTTGCRCPNDFPQCVCGRKESFRKLCSKAIRPTHREMENNPRSRSAKLRAVEKLNH